MGSTTSLQAEVSSGESTGGGTVQTEEEAEPRVDEEKVYPVYEKERAMLFGAMVEAAKLYDTQILTLSAAALALSLTFVKEVAPVIREGTTRLLVAAWLGFGLSLVAVLVSLLMSQHARAEDMRTSEKRLFGDTDAPGSTSSAETGSEGRDVRDAPLALVGTNRFARATDWLNVVSLLLFLIGLAFLGSFAASNLRAGPRAKDEGKEIRVTITVVPGALGSAKLKAGGGVYTSPKPGKASGSGR